MPGEPGLPRRPAQPPRPLREVGRASHAPPQARRREETSFCSSSSASSRVLLFLQPAARSILPLQPPPASRRKKLGEGDVSITLSTLPFPRDGDNGPFPPDAGGSPGPACGNAPAPWAPRSSPALAASPLRGGGREGAGPRGPARSPAPRRGGRRLGVTHLAVKGFHSLHVAAEAGAGRLLSADGGRAGPGRGKSRSLRARSSLRGRPASSPWRVAQGVGAGGRGPRSFPSPPGPASRPAAPPFPSLSPSLPPAPGSGRPGR